MFSQICRYFLLLCLVLCASIYAPLKAQELSTDTIPKTTSRPFWIWQITGKFQAFGGESNSGLNARFNQDLPNGTAKPAFTITNSFYISPLNLQWNHNRWIIYAHYNAFSNSSFTADYAATITSQELLYGVGYAVINTSRFRLYPMLGNYASVDILNLRKNSNSLTTLLQSSEQNSLSIARFGGLLELVVGADYSFPLEYGDVYIMAKVGYNLEVGAAWGQELLGRPIAGADPNWFSRRGVFFQLGIGLGTERR